MILQIKPADKGHFGQGEPASLQEAIRLAAADGVIRIPAGKDFIAVAGGRLEEVKI